MRHRSFYSGMRNDVTEFKILSVYVRINSRGTKQTRIYNGGREWMCLRELLHKVFPLGYKVYILAPIFIKLPHRDTPQNDCMFSFTIGSNF